jgi:nucleotide-binding universal stress UspA family protein
MNGDAMSTAATSGGTGPVLFAYDGSDLAENAITEAGGQLRAGRDALVLTVWEPFNVGFLPVGGLAFDAAGADEVRTAAEKTAAHGASLAEAAGFRAASMAAEAAPTWKGIIDAADSRDASLIVLGSHGRSGLTGLVVGSVAAAVAAHSRRSVLIVHRR